MKKIIIFVCAASMACAAASARELHADTDSSSWMNWATGGNGALWDLGGVLPTIDDTVYYRASEPRLYVSNVTDLVDNTIYAKSLTLISSSKSGSFNVDNGTAYMQVAQDISIKMEADGGFNFGDIQKQNAFQRITAGGSLTYDGSGEFSVVFANNYQYSESDPSMVIGGTINFVQSGSRWKQQNGYNNTENPPPTSDRMYTWIQLGGLNGENLRLSTNEGRAPDFNLVFKSDGKTPFTGGVWTGAFTSFWSGGRTARIIMDGGADGGMQTIRLLDSLIVDNDSSMTEQTLEMRSGKMTLGTGSVTMFTQIDMKGGTLYIDNELGSITTDVLNLDGGTIVFDIYDGGCEYIEVSEINGSLSEIVIDLDPVIFEVGMELDSTSFDLFRGTEIADWEALNGRVKFMIDGQEVSIANHVFEGMYGNGILTVSGLISEVVPEPASIAAIIGAFALAFAARRRRK